jgi:hypothetical protein
VYNDLSDSINQPFHFPAFLIELSKPFSLEHAGLPAVLEEMCILVRWCSACISPIRSASHHLHQISKIDSTIYCIEATFGYLCSLSGDPEYRMAEYRVHFFLLQGSQALPLRRFLFGRTETSASLAESDLLSSSSAIGVAGQRQGINTPTASRTPAYEAAVDT